MSQAAAKAINTDGDSPAACMAPNAMQLALKKAVLSHMPACEVALMRYAMSGAYCDQYWVASGLMPNVHGGVMAVSLPELSDTVFMCIANEPKPLVERLVCENKRR